MKASIWLILTAIFAFATDQLTKLWAVTKLIAEATDFYPLIDPYLNLQYAENYGINFGLFSGANARWVLVGISFAIIVIVLISVLRNPNRTSLIGAGLLVGGALGNVYDRIVQGFVTDFINNSLPNWHNPFSYNVADIWIFLGIGLIIFFSPRQS